MEKQKVETVLNQMKRSTYSETTVVLNAVGDLIVPYAENRVSLLIGTPAVNALTISRVKLVAPGPGITLYPATSPLSLTLAAHGSMVKGPLYASAGTFPQTITYQESLNDAP